MPDLILSLRAGHNSSACIGNRSEILFGIQEERLTYEKNYWGFPRRSIRACLDAVGAKPSDIGSIASGGVLVQPEYHSRDDIIKAFERHFGLFGRVRQRVLVPTYIKLNPQSGHQMLEKLLKEEGFGDTPIHYHDHHSGHAATAYYGLRQSPDETYLVVTADGSGDGNCSTIRLMGGGRDEIIATTDWENSLGSLYAWVTYALGFIPWEHEYKLMGMAPYVSAKAAEPMLNLFRSYLGLDEEGLRFEKKISETIPSIGPRLMKDIQGRRFDHIAAAIQLFTEEMLTSWIEKAVQKTGVSKVLAAGGVFMNVKANQKIGELDCIDSFEAFPSCGDETLSLGAYYQEAASRFQADEIRPLQNFYLGDSITDEAAKSALEKTDLSWTLSENITQDVTEILVKGYPLARCAGPMEFGARALGNRSILADPKNQDVVRVINQMVKKRDFWMPFAPVILKEKQADYIENPKMHESPYMMMTFDTKENFRELLAAVHNADLTCRAQLVDEDLNPELCKLIHSFRERTGRSVLLNTSYNLHGFPLVRTPEEAIEVFTNSGLEYMQLGNYLVSKKSEATTG